MTEDQLEQDTLAWLQDVDYIHGLACGLLLP